MARCDCGEVWRVQQGSGTYPFVFVCDYSLLFDCIATPRAWGKESLEVEQRLVKRGSGEFLFTTVTF